MKTFKQFLAELSDRQVDKRYRDSYIDSLAGQKQTKEAAALIKTFNKKYKSKHIQLRRQCLEGSAIHVQK